MASKTAERVDLKTRYSERMANLWRRAPFVLRFTEWAQVQGVVLVIKERREPDDEGEKTPQRSKLIERGHLSGEALRRCLPVLRGMVEPVCDVGGVPLELQRFLTQDGLRLRDINLPLDEEAGAKLALLFRLQERLNDLDRLELIARRITRFSREEAAYWLSRTTTFGPDANRWAISGLRVMLGGQANDAGVGRMLERLRASG